jgi:hypothetical protein
MDVQVSKVNGVVLEYSAIHFKWSLDYF